MTYRERLVREAEARVAEDRHFRPAQYRPIQPSDLRSWHDDGHERGQRYVDTGVCHCPRCYVADYADMGGEA